MLIRASRCTWLILACWSIRVLAAETSDEKCSIQLVDVTAQTGITFRHTDGGGGHQYIVESVASGLATFDYDGDGLIDIYFLNGRPLKGTETKEVPRNALYRNLGNWTFQDVTETAGVGNAGYGLGVTAADYDNDGDQDLYLNNFGPNVLYRNEGNGTFTDVTEQAGVGNGSQVAGGTCFFDIDADGDLDLYAANYVDFTYENHVNTVLGGYRYSDPKDYRPLPDTLFRNNGDGTFTDISKSSGIASVAGTSMGLVSFDYDNDGDSDLFVCNDVNPNFLFQNDGQGHFQEVGLLAGVAYNYEGRENASMGVDCGDYDNDGLLDLFMTDYTDEAPVLYHNLGEGLFEDVTSEVGAGARAFPHTNWGTAFVDFDHDGYRDLFIANGHVMDNYHLIDDRTAYRVQNILLQNQKGKQFRDVTDICGNGLDPVEASKGLAADDLDNDGDVDLVILNANAPPTILRNDSSTGRHWLQVTLQGARTNRDGVGSRVRVVAGDLVQIAELHSGHGYQSHFGTRLHFGLADRGRVDRVEVRWLGGHTEVFHNVEPDRLVVLRQGTGGAAN